MTPLVLLPGLGCDAGLWTHQFAAIPDAIVGDTLRDDSLPAMAARVLAAAPPRFALAGLSMGGYLAFEIVRQAPERVERLALLDTSARPDLPEHIATRHEAIAASEKYEYATLARSGLARLVAPQASQAVRDDVVAMAVRVGPEVYRRQQRALMVRPDSGPMLADLDLPTLVLVGAEDVLTPLAMAREMAHAIPGATLVVIEGSGHLSTLEQPDAVSTALGEWLAR